MHKRAGRSSLTFSDMSRSPGAGHTVREPPDCAAMRMLGPALRSLIACVLLVAAVLVSTTPALASTTSRIASTAPRAVDMLPILQGLVVILLVAKLGGALF